ncbi:MAG: winged helix-turn-helix transcriptional regulator [Desulfobacterales bacterium]|nr:winged helix-turn-helix transcriptional regulator [Desulfobacterales bacterium]
MQTSKETTGTVQGCSPVYELDAVARTFKALGDPNRLRLVFRLLGAERGQNVGQAAGCCPVDLSVVSRHLGVLHQAGILIREKRGKEVVYRIDQKNLPSTLRSLAEAIESCCQTPPRTMEKEK